MPSRCAAIETLRHVSPSVTEGRAARRASGRCIERAARARRDGRHRAGRSGAADLHLGHDRQPEGRAACRARAARPSAGRDAAARFLPAAGRPLLDAGRLGLGRRAARRAVAVALPRRAGGGLGAHQVRSGVGVRLHGAARHPQHLHAADRAAPDAAGAEPARAPRLCAALDRHRRREARRRHDGLGPRDLRAGAGGILRPDRGQPGDRQLAEAVPGAAGVDGPRHPRPCGRGGRRRGQRAAGGQAGRRRRAQAGPRDVPRILEAAGGNRGEIPRRLVPAGRRRRQGRGRLFLVPGSRRRHHQLGRLSHRPRRGGGMPRQASGRGARRRDRLARPGAGRGGGSLHRAGARVCADARLAARDPPFVQAAAGGARVPAQDPLPRRDADDGHRQDPRASICASWIGRGVSFGQAHAQAAGLCRGRPMQ